jgi:creatinine amidohydrolase
MTRLMEGMTWQEVEDYLRERRDVLLPLGSVEEHGPHLPLSTDVLVALEVARELSRRKGVLVAPPIWYGVSNTTRHYPGTVNVSFDALKLYVREVLKGFRSSGFERVYLLSGHLSGSQLAAIKEAAREVEGLEVYVLDLRKVSIDDIVETEPMHACEAETSLMLHLAPDLVRRERIVDEDFEVRKFALNSITPTKSGVFGKPSKASPDKGRRILERIVEEFASVIP